jgi:hypothetical protein
MVWRCREVGFIPLNNRVFVCFALNRFDDFVLCGEDLGPSVCLFKNSKVLIRSCNMAVEIF